MPRRADYTTADLREAVQLLEVAVAEAEQHAATLDNSTNPEVQQVTQTLRHLVLPRIGRGKKAIATLSLLIHEIEDNCLGMSWLTGATPTPTPDEIRGLVTSEVHLAIPSPGGVAVLPDMKVVEKWYHRLEGLAQDLEQELDECCIDWKKGADDAK